MTILLRAALFAALAAGAGAALAQFPTGTVRIVVPFPPGAFSDLAPRLVTEKLRLEWGQSVIIENRPGAAGRIAAEYVAKAPADGHTLLAAGPDQLTIAPALYRSTRYSMQDFAPVTLLWSQTLVMVVRRDLPEKSVAGIVRTAKARPGTLTWSSWGEGSLGHLSLELLKSVSGADILHVPYNGSLAANTAVASGDVDMMVTGYSTALALINSGRLRLLARASVARLAEMPEVPTIAEAGYPGYEAATWAGLVAPRATSRPVIEFIQRAVAKALGAPDILDRFKAAYSDYGGGTPEEFAKIIQKDEVKWNQIIRNATIQLD